MDESDHLALVNAGDEEVVSQEEGEGGGSAAEGELGGCCCVNYRYHTHAGTQGAREQC